MKSWPWSLGQLAVLVLFVFPSVANDKVWVGRSKVDPRDWNDGENWLPPGAPSGGDRVYIGVPPHSGTYTVEISQPIDLSSLALTRSTLHGAAKITVSGGFNSEGGSFSGGLQVALNAGGSAKRGGGGEFALGLYGASVENHGSFQVSTNSTLAFAQTISTFVNHGIVELSGGASISFTGAGESLFENKGTLRNTADGTIATLDSVLLANTGTILAQSGTLRFNLGRITNNASIQANSGATNLFAVGARLISKPGSRLGGGGWHRLVGAGWIVNGLNSAALVEFDGQAETITISPGAELELDELFTWKSGYISGTPNAGRVLINAVRTEISGPGLKTIDGVSVVADGGTTDWKDSGRIECRNGGQFVNRGDFVVSNDAEFFGSGLFLNEGLVDKRGSNTNAFTTFTADFHNRGRVFVRSGNLGLSGGRSNGRFTVLENAELQFFARRHIVEGGSSGAAGAAFFGDGFTVISDTAVWEVRENVTAEKLWLAGNGIAQVELVGDLIVSNRFNWSAGTIKSDPIVRGRVIVPGVSSIQGAARKTLDSVYLFNSGSLIWEGSGDWSVINGSRIETEDKASVTFANDAVLQGGGAPSQFRAFGHVSKRSPSGNGTTRVTAGVSFEIGPSTTGGGIFGGGLAIDSGTLQLEGGGRFARSVRLAETGVLELRQGPYDIGELAFIRGEGWTRLSGAILHCGLGQDPFDPAGLFPVGVQNLEMLAGALDSAPVNVFGVTYGGSLEIFGKLVWKGGRFTSGGSTFPGEFSSIGETEISGPDEKRIANSFLLLGGQVLWQGGGPIVLEGNSGIDIGSAGRRAIFQVWGNFAVLDAGSGTDYMRVAPGSSLRLSPGQNGRIDATVENGGDLIFEKGEYSLRKFNVNSGKVDLNGAQLKIASDLTLTGGELSGNGSVQGPVRNEGGEIKPGRSPGRVSIEDDFSQSTLGRTVFEIGGHDRAEMDLVEVTRHASLGGMVQLKFIDGFTPKAGDRFEVMKFGSVSNVFEVREGLAVSGNLLAIPEYSKTNLVFVISAAQLSTPALSAQISNGLLQLEWPAEAGRRYQIESSTDLDRWVVLTNLTATLPVLTAPPLPAGDRQRFYRLR